MRTHLFIFCLAMFILFGFAGSLKADIGDQDVRWEATPLHKLERGIVNIFTCPAELPASMISVANEKGEVFGFIIGAAEGLVTTIFRAASGVYDTVTFMIPSYSKPIMEPEYAIQSLENSQRY